MSCALGTDGSWRGAEGFRSKRLYLWISRGGGTALQTLLNSTVRHINQHA